MELLIALTTSVHHTTGINHISCDHPHILIFVDYIIQSCIIIVHAWCEECTFYVIYLNGSLGVRTSFWFKHLEDKMDSMQKLTI